MKNKIQAVYQQSVFCSSTAPKLYIADFTERTSSNRKVEFHENIPQAPDSDKDMDCLVFENSSELSVICNIFDDHQFKDNEENEYHIASVYYFLKVRKKI